MSERYYVTTPIYYVNGPPHIGHAYTSIAADVLARWKRLDGYDVFFLTGTDEHGQKVESAARDAGLSPQEFVDRVSADFQDMTARMGCSNDDFIRTTEDRHKRACIAMWEKLRDAGQIYAGHYEGWYAVRDETFYVESELTLRADGVRIAPTGAPVEWVREPNYLFRLSEYQQRLLDYYEANPDALAPLSARNEVLSFLRGGLNDLSVSRSSFTWGIPVPGDPSQVMYVWLDALTNYLSAVGYPAADGPRWGFWPANLHLVGKDILRFHAVYWPAFLLAAGLSLPRRIYGQGWWTIEGEKMSKSIGNVIDPRELVDIFGLDAVRYFLLREVPYGNDGDYSRRALIARKVELANDLGNLAQRSLSLIARNCDGRLPLRAAPTDDDRSLLDAANALPGQLREAFDRQAFGDGLEHVWKVVRAANSYIVRQEPWKLRATDAPRMGAVLCVLADVVRVLATVLQPFMPGSMAQMLDQLGVPGDQRSLAALDRPIPSGVSLPPPQGIFPKHIEDVV